MAVWVGTSGYSFSDWVGDFYPPGTPSNRMLAYYSRQFPLVELNFTFYRPPTRAMLLRIADQTPPGFQFLVKIPQTISHEQSTADLSSFRHAAEGLQERGQLKGVLCQFPQSTHATGATCRWIEALGRELSDLRLAVEFRHRSWDRPGLPDWLRERQIDLVSVDVPKIAALFPGGLRQSSDRVYVRFHSRLASNWYEGGADRYDYDYTDQELGEWVNLVRHADAGEALFLFNNCHRSQATVNARRMRELLRSQAPELDLVEPPAAEGPVQRTLFD